MLPYEKIKAMMGRKQFRFTSQRVGGWGKPMGMALYILTPELFRRTVN